jgi:hypothetical protein
MATAVRRPSALAIAALACIALAGVSLLLPSGPSYDPYQWLIWGRELAHLQLDTTGSGTSWKPLTALVAALLAPLGHAQPDAFLVVVRGGGLFAVFMAFRLAARLAPPGWAWPAGLAAAATLVLTGHIVGQTAVGNIEALTTGLVLLAVDRHLDGRRGQAFAAAVAAALMRPESWPFLLVYGLWLWRARERPRRVLIAAGAALVPLLWFGGDWIGSGRLSHGSDVALRPIPGTPGAGPHPIGGVLSEAWTVLPPPARVVVPAAIALTLVDGWRSRRDLRAPGVVKAALAAGALAWIAVVALMAKRGYPGESRFLFPAAGMLAVLVGDAIARAGALVPRSLPRPLQRVAPLAALLLLALLVVPDAGQLRVQAASVDRIADQDTALQAAVHEIGGARDVFECGRPATGWWAVPALAYDLGVRARVVNDRPVGRRPVVFKLDRGTSGLRAPLPRRHMRVVDRVSDWEVVDRCGIRTATQPAPRASAPGGS